MKKKGDRGMRKRSARGSRHLSETQGDAFPDWNLKRPALSALIFTWKDLVSAKRMAQSQMTEGAAPSRAGPRASATAPLASPHTHAEPAWVYLRHSVTLSFHVSVN